VRAISVCAGRALATVHRSKVMNISIVVMSITGSYHLCKSFVFNHFYEPFVRGNSSYPSKRIWEGFSPYANACGSVAPASIRFLELVARPSAQYQAGRRSPA
jgi:hypothetical protein